MGSAKLFRFGYALLICVMLLLSACDEPVVGLPKLIADPIDPNAPLVRVTVNTGSELARVSERFLSFTMDTSKIFRGTPLDLDNPRLQKLTQALWPSWIRIGGTTADHLYYDLSDNPVAEPPEPYEYVVNQKLWSRACRFARTMKMDLVFNLNAGTGPRQGRVWMPDQARGLISYSRSIDCPVKVWELGNEPGAFIFEHNFGIKPEELAADYRTLRKLLDELDPNAKLAGIAGAYWPVLGEVAIPLLRDFMRVGGDIDLMTWHYYPQQSASCPIQSRRARLKTMLAPKHLDEIHRWADEVTAIRDEFSPQVPIWLGETSHAQCGGETGVSDRFVTGFWWMDQLGLIARRGQQVVARQQLVGGAYTLIRFEGFVPAPDFYNSVLWKRLMGQVVLDATTPDELKTLRLYSHCTKGRPGAVTVLAINVHEEQGLTLTFPPQLGPRRELYLLTADALDSEELRLNGEVMRVGDDGTVPQFLPRTVGGRISLPRLSYALIVFPDADAAACRL